MELATHPGNYGSKRQSWANKNPRDLLLDLMKSHEGSSEEELYEIFYKHIDRNDSYLPAIVEYWFTNNYRAAMGRSISRKNRVAMRALHRTRVKLIIGQVKLLSLTMINGKKLSDCTGNECIMMGGWLTKVGLRVGKKLVGDVLSEAQLKKLI